jgi:hypothetical protein
LFNFELTVDFETLLKWKSDRERYCALILEREAERTYCPKDDDDKE